MFVDLERDSTVADVRRAIGAGLRSVEHVKRYTTIGTGSEQGKLANVNAIRVAAELLQVHPGELGTTTFRPPYLPVSFALLAGRDRGQLFDPVRVTPIHPAHVEAGAVFEDVGQWKRPRYFPRDGRGHGRGRPARVRRRARVGREDGRDDARQDRRPGPRRGRVPQPHVHERVRLARGRQVPLRASCARSTGWSSTTASSCASASSGSSARRRPATPRPCSRGWRSGCRPSGRSCASG